MNMDASLVKKANACFFAGDFQQAKTIYQQLSQQFGDTLFNANIKLCDLRLGSQLQEQYSEPVRLEEANAGSVTFEQIKEQLKVTQSQLEYYFQQCQNLQLRLMEQNK